MTKGSSETIDTHEAGAWQMAVPRHEGVEYNVLIRASQLDTMRDPIQASWNRPPDREDGATPSASDLTDLIDFGQMNAIFSNFLEVTGLPVAILDLNTKVLASSKWQRICMEFHRVQPDALTRCQESDRSLSKEMQAGNDIAIYRCHNGLTDCAAPIVVDGVHIANLFIGQFLLKEPDLTFFKRQQEEFGFDEAGYFKALAEVPIVSEARLPAILNLVTGLAGQVADLSLARQKALQAHAEVERKVEERTQQLRDSETRLSAAERIAHIGNWHLDLVTNILHWSPEIFRLFEIDPQRFGASYEAFLEAIHPDDREMVNHAYLTSLEHRCPYEVTHRLQMPDGRIKYVHEHCETTFSSDGKPLHSLGTVQDVTERHQVALALQESETLYRELFRASGDAIFLHTILPTGEPDRFLRTNEVACQRLGYSEAELLNLSPKDIDAGGMDSKRLEAVRELMTEGQALFEMVHVTKSGRNIPVEISARKIELLGQLMVLSLVRDITERKLAEEALQRQLNSLRALNEIDASPDASLEGELANALAIGAQLLGLELGIISHIVDERYEVFAQVSPAGALSAGQRFDLGITYCVITLDQERGGVLAIPHMGVSSYLGHPCYASFKLEAYIGTPLYVEGKLFGTVNFSSAIPYHREFDAGDNEFMRLLSRWVGAAIERANAQRQLAENAEKLRRLYELSPLGIALTDMEGRYIEFNESFRQICGYPEDELKLLDYWTLTPSCYEADEGRQLESIRQHGRYGPYEKEYRQKNGHLIPVRLNGVLVSVADGKHYIWSIVEDITERVRTDAELKRHREHLEELVDTRTHELAEAKVAAESANNAKSRFLAAASHDLRQPLSALSIYANLLNYTQSPAEQKVVANIKECIGSLSGMLTDLLDLSKLEAGVVAPDVRDFAIAETLASLASVNTPEANIKGLQLRCLPSRLTVRSDPVHFRRILGNLIENAIRYTERGGVLVACRRRQNKTWIEVWDTGIGIPVDKTTEIFEEFKQLGDGARNNGSGLGLAIVAKTAALLGLAINVRSRPGRGSVFAIELPLGQALPAMPAPVPSAVDIRLQRIALVDDNPIVRTALVAALQDLGHQVVAAASKATVLAELGAQPPDIVVSDYRLTQGETGFDVIKALRARFGDELPAILITGDTDPNLLRSMTERGIIVLHKPLDLETLQKCIVDLTCQAM